MKRILLTLVLLFSTFAASALTLNLPDVVKDGDTPSSGQEFWCNNDSVKDGTCETVQVDPGFNYILVHQNGTSACPAGFWSYININRAVGYTAETKADSCDPTVKAALYYDSRTNRTVIGFTRGNDVLDVLTLK